MIEQTLVTFGRWDILVNNAAAAITKPFAEITEAEFDLSFAVNVKGVFHGLQLWPGSTCPTPGGSSRSPTRPAR